MRHRKKGERQGASRWPRVEFHRNRRIKRIVVITYIVKPDEEFGSRCGSEMCNSFAGSSRREPFPHYLKYRGDVILYIGA